MPDPKNKKESPLEMMKPVSPFNKSRCWTGYDMLN